MSSFKSSILFKRDYKRVSKNTRYADFEFKLREVLQLIILRKPLPSKYKEHKLKGLFIGCHECHLAPDLLLVYRYKEECIELVRLGSHSDLF